MGIDGHGSFDRSFTLLKEGAGGSVEIQKEVRLSFAAMATALTLGLHTLQCPQLVHFLYLM